MTTSPRRPRVTVIRPAGDNHQVVSVTGGSRGYRRRPCGPETPTEVRPGCPWRVDAIGFFPAEAFAHSADTSNDMSSHMFACHESGTENPKTCAGFLLRGADHNMAVRMKLATGQIDPAQIDDGGYELHHGYISMAAANGVHPRDPALRNCRLSYEEDSQEED